MPAKPPFNVGSGREPILIITMLASAVLKSCRRSETTQPAEGPKGQLVVFADDWGRHPSSAQHLVRQLGGRYEVVWVNTVGTRRMSLRPDDVRRAAGKLVQWVRRDGEAEIDIRPAWLKVLHPVMWPGFGRAWQRRFNAGRIGDAVAHALGRRKQGQKRWAITTLPITADLVGRIDVDGWLYYCVDDFSVWPGLDGQVLATMERELVAKVDAAVAVSEVLQQRLAEMGKVAPLLTHGIDVNHWRGSVDLSSRLEGIPRPVVLFWGLIDGRLDAAICRALVEAGFTLALAGPQQSPPEGIRSLAWQARREKGGLHLLGPVGYEDLPGLAAEADVLVMPYADLPVTRAMQPLKFKEYLATGKPVVARNLPGVTGWADAADLVDDAAGFVEAVKRRLREGLPADQAAARARLADESWPAKARQLEEILLDL
ncbi:MAG: glycosyltransferase [Phycisphaeraceae bacterium]|nr:glycosyltransferase [Phycisphaeraceae bacterium]